MDCSIPDFPGVHCSPEFAQAHDCPTTSVFPSIRVFSSESVLHIRWPKYWRFSFSISPSSEYSGWISFMMNWFHFLAVQGTLKSLLQDHNSKTPVLHHSAFFMVQLSYLYMTRWIFVSKGISLLFNTLSRFVIFPSKEQASLNFMSAVTILNDSGAQKKKICHCFHFFPFCLP